MVAELDRYLQEDRKLNPCQATKEQKHTKGKFKVILYTHNLLGVNINTYIKSGERQSIQMT